MAAPATSPELAPLVTILSREKAVYQQLLQVTAEERQAIVDGKLPGIKAALQRKQEILERLATLEERRIGWLQRYARKHRLDLETMTLASLIEASTNGDREVLGRLHRALRRQIDRLVQMNAVTKSLLNKLLSSIDVSLHFLLADEGSGPTYGAQGRLQPSANVSRQLLECKA
ncbi:MAG TPA: flagellar protein FlgN [Chloroflexota bacterium]|nr:flagellar protein FlgN [Chloroflexota bacterium]